MASTSTTPSLSPREGYRRWARSYDTDLNPMLSLEKRYLGPMLSGAVGLDVVDLGCGTGRWLQILRSAAPRSLLGIDSSPEMLRQARRKLNGAARLVHGDGSSVSLAPASADLVLGSFLLSYVEEAQRLLFNARAALRENGSLFLTDVHPDTSFTLRWKRGVRGETGFQIIRTVERSIESVISLCEEAGLRLVTRLEPVFGEAERGMFAAAGKTAEFARAAGYPAIYILEFRLAGTSRIKFAPMERESALASICNAHISIGPQERVCGTLRLSNSRIDSMVAEEGSASPCIDFNDSIDLPGFLLLPGLVNAHDHLEFALFPRLGTGEYRNSVEWAEDIHRRESAVIAVHRQVPKDVRLWWGGIRNLLCGATTVSHHNPYDATVFDSDFAVRVLREYGWAHSMTMDSGVAQKKSQTQAGLPFVIHLGEGIDKRSEDEIKELHRLGALDEDTVLVHGLALDKSGRALLRKSWAGLIWCPSSNVFLFGRTLSPWVIESLPRLALGSDSPLTAIGDLLDEVRFACSFTQLHPDTMYHLVTHRAAQLLRLREGQGRLCSGAIADIIAVRDRGRSPAETLTALTYRDVELVLIGGRVHLASDEIWQRLPHGARIGLQPIVVEDTPRWIRAPLERLFRETEPHLTEGIFLGGKRVNFGTCH
jgi:cytosine/adenosine deaminase-related metal-dependent hydrolase/ubiquinone/menaquinone biosynthesis C-methylase UbiE